MEPRLLERVSELLDLVGISEVADEQLFEWLQAPEAQHEGFRKLVVRLLSPTSAFVVPSPPDTSTQAAWLDWLLSLPAINAQTEELRDFMVEQMRLEELREAALSGFMEKATFLEYLLGELLAENLLIQQQVATEDHFILSQAFERVTSGKTFASQRQTDTTACSPIADAIGDICVTLSVAPLPKTAPEALHAAREALLSAQQANQLPPSYYSPLLPSAGFTPENESALEKIQKDFAKVYGQRKELMLNRLESTLDALLKSRRIPSKEKDTSSPTTQASIIRSYVDKQLKPHKDAPMSYSLFQVRIAGDELLYNQLRTTQTDASIKSYTLALAMPKRAAKRGKVKTNKKAKQKKMKGGVLDETSEEGTSLPSANDLKSRMDEGEGEGEEEEEHEEEHEEGEERKKPSKRKGAEEEKSLEELAKKKAEQPKEMSKREKQLLKQQLKSQKRQQRKQKKLEKLEQTNKKQQNEEEAEGEGQEQ
ncbi:Myelin transcription factor 1 [Balamuthia mandrillaris]